MTNKSQFQIIFEKFLESTLTTTHDGKDHNFRPDYTSDPRCCATCGWFTLDNPRRERNREVLNALRSGQLVLDDPVEISIIFV